MRSEFDKDYMIELVRIILENVHFKFNEEIYRQRMGTAIKTKFGTAYANIFMSRLERNMLREAVLKPWIRWRFLNSGGLTSEPSGPWSRVPH